mgnify:CR=1 FL=1
MILSTAVVDEAVPAEGRAIVGLKLAPGRAPGNLLLPSSRVRLIAMPAAADSSTTDKLAGSIFVGSVIDQSPGSRRYVDLGQRGRRRGRRADYRHAGRSRSDRHRTRRRPVIMQMAILLLTSTGGSPGVTTLAVGLALTWPRPILPCRLRSGSASGRSWRAISLVGRSSGKGLLRVAEAHRDRRPLREVSS